MRQPPRAMPPEEVLKARRRFAGWLRWYMATHPEEVPNQTELGRRLRVTKGGVKALIDEHGLRAPSFDTLIAAKSLVGVGIDALLFTDPPEYPDRGTTKRH